MWILIVIIMGTNSQHPSRLTMQEFTSEARCRAAGEVVLTGMATHSMQRLNSAINSRAATVECVAR